jgi:hypothetical protein
VVRTVRIEELQPIEVAGVKWRPVRRALGITGFGINAYSADAGEQLIEEHDETGAGAGQHEELYLVLTGHARFTVDGQHIDAPAGTLVFVPETSSRRAAEATADGTNALVIGGDTGTIKPSAWEHYFAAQPAADAGDPQQAYETAAAGLEDHADNGSLHYNLACYASLAGDADRAITHLGRAFELEPKTREWAERDADLDAIRSDARYPTQPAEPRQ